jgi:hypothetical protein
MMIYVTENHSGACVAVCLNSGSCLLGFVPLGPFHTKPVSSRPVQSSLTLLDSTHGQTNAFVIGTDHALAHRTSPVIQRQVRDSVQSWSVICRAGTVDVS